MNFMHISYFYPFESRVHAQFYVAMETPTVLGFLYHLIKTEPSCLGGANEIQAMTQHSDTSLKYQTLTIINSSVCVS